MAKVKKAEKSKTNTTKVDVVQVPQIIESKQEIKQEPIQEIKQEIKQETKEETKQRIDYNPIPLMVKLPDNKDSLTNHKADPKYSVNIDYPEFAYGFQHFIHASKNKTEILKDFENKKKVYLVMNPFERYVDNYDNNIGNMTKTYFKTGDKKPDVLSRGFYKLWELLFMFDLIPKEGNFISAHLAEGPGSFIQATMFYRDLFSKDSSKDKYYAVTLHSEDTDGHIPALESEFVNFYNSEKPKRFILHETYTKQVAGAHKDRDNGDITDPKTLKLFGGQMGSDKADFITADGGFDWHNENTQEQEAFRLIFAQIVGAVKLQKKGGAFVCKFFETFSNVSMKFLAILKEFYTEVYLVKPLMSRPSNSEKYAVCMGFKENKKLTENLEQILKESHENQEKNLVDLFPNFKCDKNFIQSVTNMNINIANTQFKAINNIIDFINKQNYYGDVYQLQRHYQISANNYWTSTYFPDKSKYQESIKKLHNMVSEETKKTQLIIDELSKKLI
jgi:hypothetical protein